MAGLEQHREHVVAIRAVAAAFVDQVEDQRVRVRAQPLEVRPRAAPGDVDLEERQQRQRRGPECEDRGEAVAQRVEAPAGVEPEDSAEDDLERQRLEARVERDRPVARPLGRLALGDLRHQAGQPLHLLPVEGGQHQLALLEVVALVEQDHRVADEHRLEDPCALAGVQDVRRRGEQLLQVLRVREHHERRSAQQPDGEALAVARSAALEEGVRPRQPAERLHDDRHARTGWKSRLHLLSLQQGTRTARRVCVRAHRPAGPPICERSVRRARALRPERGRSPGPGSRARSSRKASRRRRAAGPACFRSGPPRARSRRRG